MSDVDLPLMGKTALVTGVSRRKGIGYAIAVQLAQLGADVVAHHHRPHDTDQPWGSDDLDAVRSGIRTALRPGGACTDIAADLAQREAPNRVISQALELTGQLDILVCNHARAGGDGSIFDMTEQALDGHWAVNARSSILLTRGFATAFAGLEPRSGEATRPGDRIARQGPVDEFATGRVFWTTSGQQHGPMPGEVAYAASKAALAGLTATVASELLPHGIILNTINPGPVNTGYLDPDSTDRSLEAIEQARSAMPFGRFGQPTDPARLVGWLSTEQGRWIVGQVLTTDGGFSL